jgi:hypothetical protein
LPAILVTGHEASTINAPDNEEEWRKLVTGLLIHGDQVVHIDNVIGLLKSATLSDLTPSTGSRG